MSVFVIFFYRVPVTWKYVRHPRTSLISCKDKVRATNECTKLIQYLRHVLLDLYHIDLSIPTKCYNNNHDCMECSESLTTKGMKHTSLCYNHTIECVHLKEIEILPIAGKLNISDIFTK